MRKLFLILFSPILLVSCSEQKKENRLIDQGSVKVETTKKKLDSLIIPKGENISNISVVERYFPDEKDTVEFDTIIVATKFSISIERRFLDSYVTNEFESEGRKHIDKYRDSEKHLIIKHSDEILVDTVFKKNDFVDLAGRDFLKIADFHGYWFNGIKNDTIELFGIISKPETDWSFAFYHYFDLRTKTFNIAVHTDE